MCKVLLHLGCRKEKVTIKSKHFRVHFWQKRLFGAFLDVSLLSQYFEITCVHPQQTCDTNININLKQCLNKFLFFATGPLINRWFAASLPKTFEGSQQPLKVIKSLNLRDSRSYLLVLLGSEQCLPKTFFGNTSLNHLEIRDVP